MLKKLIALLLCFLLVISFSACKKDKGDVDSSSQQTSSSDPTQDYENDQWDEGENLTEEEKDKVEDLWNDLIQNGGAQIVPPDENNNTSLKEDANDSNSNVSSSNSKPSSNKDMANEFDDASSTTSSSSSKNSNSVASSNTVSSSRPSSSKVESSSKPTSSGSSSSSTGSESKPVDSSKPTQSESASSNSSNTEDDREIIAEIVVSRPAIW